MQLATAAHRAHPIANHVWLDPVLRGRSPNESFAVTKGLCDWYRKLIRTGKL